VPASFLENGVLNCAYTNVDVDPYGHLHLPDSSNNYEGMIEAMVDVLKDPRVWDPNGSAKSVPNQPTNPNASAAVINQTTSAARITRAEAMVPLDGSVQVSKPSVDRVWPKGTLNIGQE